MKQFYSYTFVLLMVLFSVTDLTEAQNGWTAIDGINSDGTVYSIVPYNDELYVSGQSIRYYEDENTWQPIAIYSLGTNTWSRFYDDIGPSRTPIINDIQLHGDILYMGGAFRTIGPYNFIQDAFTSENFAGINLENKEWLDVGLSDKSTPPTISQTGSFAILGETVYTGGVVSTVRHFERENGTYMAIGNLETGQWSVLDPNLNNSTLTQLIYNDKLYVGGQFTEMQGEPVGGMAVYDLTTEEWQPLNTSLRFGNSTGRIRAIAAHEGNIYVGGFIQELDGIPARGVAVYNIADETWSELNFNIGGTVWDLHIADGILYIGGSFSSILKGEQPDVISETVSRNIIAYRISDGAYSSLGDLGTTGSSSTVYAITKHEKNIYVGGSFDEMEGEESRGLAVYDLDYLDFKFLRSPTPPASLNITYNDGVIGLTWEAEDLDTIVSQRLYGGASPSTMEVITELGTEARSYSEDLQSGTLYAVQLIYEGGAESELSNVVSYYAEERQFTAEWDLVSVPFNTVGVGLEQSEAFGFNRVYHSAGTLEPGNGYWVRSDQNEQVDLNGEGLLETSLSLNKGWNLIGGPAGEAGLASIVDSGSLLTTTPVYAYSNGVYVETSTLELGAGYWIYASDAGNIRIKLDALSAKKISVSAKDDSISEPYHTIRFGNDSATQEFFVSEQSAERDVYSRFMLPPVSPSPVLDVRTSAGYRFTDNRSASIDINSATYPVSVTLESPEQDDKSDQVYRLIAREAGDEIHLNLLPGVSVQLDREYEELVLEKVHRDEVITDFAITPNYPNPFNPTTTIRYQLSNQADVSVMVYDILGRRVATLVNSRQQAGVYTVSFDANNLASGVYMLQIHAGDFTDIQKMTLIK